MPHSEPGLGTPGNRSLNTERSSCSSARPSCGQRQPGQCGEVCPVTGNPVGPLHGQGAQHPRCATRGGRVLCPGPHPPPPSPGATGNILLPHTFGGGGDVNPALWLGGMSVLPHVLWISGDNPAAMHPRAQGDVFSCPLSHRSAAPLPHAGCGTAPHSTPLLPPQGRALRWGTRTGTPRGACRPHPAAPAPQGESRPRAAPAR